jgi:hypothetical protein
VCVCLCVCVCVCVCVCACVHVPQASPLRRIRGPLLEDLAGREVWGVRGQCWGVLV